MHLYCISGIVCLCIVLVMFVILEACVLYACAGLVLEIDNYCLNYSINKLLYFLSIFLPLFMDLILFDLYYFLIIG